MYPIPGSERPMWDFLDAYEAAKTQEEKEAVVLATPDSILEEVFGV